MGGTTSKEPAPLDEDDDFMRVDNYSGSYKNGKRHGLGIYYFANGDIYDGQWRKGRKEGYGKYVFAKGECNIGWFYRDEYIGKEPNEKLRRKMKKKRMSLDEEGEVPLPKDSSVIQTETTNVIASDSDTDDDVPKLKDTSGINFRRAESAKRQKYYRAKYNIPDKNQSNAADRRDQRESVRAKLGLSRTKSAPPKIAKGKYGSGNTATTTTSNGSAKDPKMLSEQEEMDERRKSKRLRESIRAKYKLRS